ncbi:MAG: hypothetical protein Q8P67_25150, partial [archaeon]|nr:hypothetical protein [archaeon]
REDASTASTDTDLSFILPKNLLKRFLTIADVRVQIAGLLYGAPPANASSPLARNIREVRVIVIPAQLGSLESVVLPEELPQHTLLQGLQPLGWIRTQPEPLDYITLPDLQQTAAYFPDPQSAAVFVSCTLINNGFSLSAVTFQPRGYELLKKYPQRLRDQSLALPRSAHRPSKLVLGDIFLGFFLAPRLWNYHFMGVKFNAREQHPLALAVPKDFYHPEHRFFHFQSRAFTESADSPIDLDSFDPSLFDFDDFGSSGLL